jgi:hypothetical protein
LGVITFISFFNHFSLNNPKPNHSLLEQMIVFAFKASLLQIYFIKNINWSLLTLNLPNKSKPDPKIIPHSHNPYSQP